MNESGRSVAPALRFYKLPPERLVVVHDELDLELGDVRAKQGGGLAGHNGLRSLAEALGTQDFLRVRIGIGRPERGDRRPVADWVLQPFPPGTDVDRLVRDGADCALSVVRDGRGRGDAHVERELDGVAPVGATTLTRRCGRARPRRRPIRRLDHVRAVVQPLLECAAQILAAHARRAGDPPAGQLRLQAAHHLRRLVQPRAHLVFAHSARGHSHRAQA